MSGDSSVERVELEESVDILIRRMRDDEMETMVELRCRFLREIRGETPTPEFRRATVDFMTRHRDDGVFLCLVAVAAGEIVATVMLAVQEFPPRADYPCEKVGYIYNVYTLPGHRGGGLAARLLQACLDEARRMGVFEFRLQAEEAAIPLYKRLGFVMAHHDMVLHLPCGQG